MNENRLRVENLVKRFPGFTLGPISFELSAGVICGLLGPNGAGKTTLLNCLAGQARLNEGVCRWDGRALGWGDWRYREDVGFVRENPLLYDGLTVDQMLCFASKIYGRWDLPFTTALRQKFGLDARKKVRDLSKGMRVKLSIIIGLAHGASLLLLDEPTSGIDPDARSELHVLIRELGSRHGACVLISSHVFEDIELTCNEVKVVRGGQLVFESTTENIRATLAEGRSGTVRDVYFASKG